MNDFNIGDTVKVINVDGMIINKKPMDDYLGKVGIIEKVQKYEPKYFVRFNVDDYWCFCEEKLEKEN